MTKLIFVDCETTSLSLETGEIWECAAIYRDTETNDPDDEYHWFLPVGDLNRADPFALNIGKFWERHPTALWDQGLSKETDGWAGITGRNPFAHEFWRLSKDAHFVANVPDFDAYRIAKIIKSETQFFPMWHYHLICCENLTAGLLRHPPPWKSDEIFEKLGYKRNEETQHTALGDAREVRDIYDLIMHGNVPGWPDRK